MRGGSAGRRAWGGLALVPLMLLSLLVVGSWLLGGALSPPRAGISPSHPMARPDSLSSAVGVTSASCVGEFKAQVNSTDPNGSVNDGLRVNVTGFAAGQFPSNASFQVSVEEKVGAFDAVFGLFENSQTRPVPFYSIFDATSDSNLFLAYWATLPLSVGTGYDFELLHSAGTNWTLTVNGALFGGNESNAIHDFGVPTTDASSNATFSEVAFAPDPTIVPGSLVVPLALAVHLPGGWYLPDDGIVHLCGSFSAWGLEGRLQHPTLAPGELITGTEIAAVPDGTVLWQGGRVPVDVSASLGAPTIAGTASESVAVQVTSSSGAPLPGVYLSANDSLGGLVLPPTAATDSSGKTSLLFQAPNVSANATDELTVAVTLFGYVGSASLSTLVVPARELLLVPAVATLTVTEGGSVAVTFVVSATSGAPVPGILVGFSLDASGNVSPAYGVTDSLGRVSTNFEAPGFPLALTLRADVLSGGSWGHATVNLRVTGAADAAWMRLVPYAAAGVVVGVGSALAVLLVRRRRRRRQPIPAMALKAGPRGPAPSGPADAPPPAQP